MGDIPLHEWCRRWLSDQWIEWQPRTRRTYCETLARFIVIAASTGTREARGLRAYVQRTLAPDAIRDASLESWLARSCPRLAALDRTFIATIERQLLLRGDGRPLAATTANRTRIVCRACVRAAVDAGAIPDDPWPQRPPGRSRRKVARPQAH